MHIDRGVLIVAPERLKAGPGLVLARGVVMTCAGGVHVGAGCLFGYYSFVCAANHSIPARIPEPIYGGGHDLAPVVIGNNCWVGAHSCVLPGVILEDGVVGAGTTVARDMAAGSVVVGASPRVVRVRLPYSSPVNPAGADAPARERHSSLRALSIQDSPHRV